MDITSDGPVLVLSGDFDGRSTREVRAALYEHLEAVGGDVVVDLTEVETVDLLALRVLAMATRVGVRSGRQVTLRGCGPTVLRMLHKSRLFPLVEVEREAVPA